MKNGSSIPKIELTLKKNIKYHKMEEFMKRLIYLFFGVFLIISACSVNDNDMVTPPKTMQDLDIPEGFDFSSEQSVDLKIVVNNYNNVPIPGIVYDIAYVNSMNEHLKITKAITDEAGEINRQLILPSYVEKLYLSGLMNSFEVEIIDGTASYYQGPNNGFAASSDNTPPVPSRSFSYLDGITYTPQGVPVPSNFYAIEPEMMARISTSLPEYLDLAVTHLKYLADGIETNFICTEAVEVWITFVSEGASFQNAFGFYTYDQPGEPPPNPASLDHTIIFPNCSYPGQGGGLVSGTQIYLGQFSAGTALGWFLVKDGWDVDGDVSETAQRYYSDKGYNPEDPPLKQHQVLLYDQNYELFVIGFEDNDRIIGDNDFNDAVFIAHAIPLENLDFEDVPLLDIPPDTDKDGVSDPVDEYPHDYDRAFNLYFPSENYATIVFEDLWPTYGDYDMNDMVIDYRYLIVTNAQGLMKDINVLGKLRAAGASYNNGFSIEFPFDYGEVTITDNSGNITPVLVEDNYTILDLFSNTTSLTGQSVPAAFNTNMDLPYHQPVVFFCNLTLANHVDLTELDFLLPFNLFMIQQGDVSHEIHLINHQPTSRADSLLFKTGDDYSDPPNNYYLSDTNLPWALNMPESWHYPAERNSIIDVYYQFADWAESGGFDFLDWYLYQSDHVDMDKVYIEP